MKKAKFILLAMIALLALEGCGGEATKTDVEKANLKGKVKYVSEHYYAIQVVDDRGSYTQDPIENETENGVVDYIETYYDEKGRIDKYREVWGGYMNTDTYIYSKNLLSEIKHAYNANRKPGLTTYTYNKDKSIFKVCSQKDSYNEYIYKYDIAGNVIDDGRFKYKYDEKGNVIEKTSDSYKRQSKYDDFGREIEYILEGEIYGDFYREYVATEYNNEGDLVKRIYINDIEKKYSITNTNTLFDKLGLIDGVTCATILNEQAQQVENLLGDDAEFVIYQYSDYDNRGNWRTQTSIINGSPSTEVCRNIKYHDEKEEPNYEEGSSAERLNNLLKNAYESGMSYYDILNIPEVKNKIISKYSEKFYEMIVYYADDETILHKSDGNNYFLKCMNHSGKYSCGSWFTFNENSWDPIMIKLFLYGFSAESDGSLSIRPWKEKFYENDFGEVDENSPYYSILEEWIEYPSREIKVEVRIDSDGIKFIKRDGWTDFQSNAKVKVKVNSTNEILVLPIKYHKGILYITWDDEEAGELIDLWSSNGTTVSITENFYGDDRKYTKEFYSMERTALVAATFSGW